ncbi:MAG: hypothetical protein ABI406_04325 [Ktedonobacteraceae bacterium]
MFTRMKTRAFGKVMVMLFSMALLCVLTVGSPVASAQTIQKAASVAHISAPHGVHPKTFPTPTYPCKSVRSKYYYEFCFTPSVTSKCGQGQYWPTNDLNNQPIDWTKTDYSHECVDVSYSYTFASSYCYVYFYVPNGYGDAKFKYSINGNGFYYINPIDEGSYSNYISMPIFNPTSSGTMTFTDHVTDPNLGNLALGWGRGTTDGLEEICD